MKVPYTIEEILLQSSHLVVYRVRDTQGQDLALTRLLLNDEDVKKLHGGAFQEGLKALQSLSHPCLRQVFDGGMDEVDGAPWIVSRHWDGASVRARYHEKIFQFQNKTCLEGQTRDLILSLGGYAGALSFNGNEVIETQATDGSLVETFTIDFREWFLGWIREEGPRYEKNPELGLARLLGSLPVSAPVNSATAVPAFNYQPQLASATSRSCRGLITALCLLVGAIGAGVYWLNQKEDPEPELVQEEVIEGEKEVLIDKAPGGLEKLAPKASQISKREPDRELVVETEPGLDRAKVVQLPKRPPAGELREVMASDLDAVEGLVGKWVLMQGKIARMNGDDVWVIAKTLKNGEEMVAIYAGREEIDVAGETIEMMGYLKSDRILEIEKRGDVTIFKETDLHDEEHLYTLEDEAKVRSLEGSVLSFQGKVLEARLSSAAKKNIKGGTMYLYFTDGDIPLALGVKRSTAEKGLDFKFLKGLVGQEIKVTGLAGKEFGGRRFLIRSSRKDQIQSQ